MAFICSCIRGVCLHASTYTPDNIETYTHACTLLIFIKQVCIPQPQKFLVFSAEVPVRTHTSVFLPISLGKGPVELVHLDKHIVISN